MTLILTKIIPGYIAVISLIAIAVTIYDKIAAKLRNRRVSEKALMIIGAVGGAAAMFIAMLAIRHKTRHPKFMVGLPLIIVVQIILMLLVYSIFT